MKTWRFFIVHSLRDMLRNRTRTAFALVCVATGVAAVVALRSLAFMVADELTTNLAQINRGDIRVFASRDVPELAEYSTQGDPVFTREALAAFEEWADDQGYELTAARMNMFKSVRRVADGVEERPQPLLPLGIDSSIYPFYDSISLQEPSGMTLEDAFGTDLGPAQAAADLLLPRLSAVAGLPTFLGTGGASLWAPTSHYVAHPHPVVISSNLTRASSLGLAAGDILRVGATPILFRVEGIVPAAAESILTVPQTVLFDYVYFYAEDLIALGDVPLMDQVFIKLPLGTDVSAAENDLIRFLGGRFGNRSGIDENLNRATVAELEGQNEQTASVIDDLILVMGLSSLLIGGIGIINTMLVVVSRRTLEIAVLKTLGLKGSRVTVLFLVEAVLMGLLGSLLGVVIGVGLSYVIKSVGEEGFYLDLSWRLYPEAMLSGVFLGVVMTALFGFLPTLVAGQVRPAIVLRPNEAQMPAAGLLQTLVTLLVMIGVLGMLVNSIVGGAISVSPVIMLLGAGALIGLFGGVISGNTRVGKPLPDYYVFRLSRRYERADNWLVDLAGGLARFAPVPAWRALARRDRGRAAITAGVRGLRQLVLAYGSLAIGAVLASVFMWLGSELWLPMGGSEPKPSGDILAAVENGRVLWATVWLAATCSVGIAIRRLARQFVGVIALGSLGASLGAGLGLGLGRVLESSIAATGVWETLSEISTGIVIVEGALALLGAIYVGYWLLVWVVAKMPSSMLLAVVSGVMVLLVAAVGGLVAVAGPVGLVLVVAVAVALWVVLRRWQRTFDHSDQVVVDAQKGGRAQNGYRSGAWRGSRGVLVLVLAMAVTGVGFAWAEWSSDVARVASVVMLGGVAFVIWQFLRRRHRVDGRLVLREMDGRRGRVASTLLGLSVGVAGLSLVSLTTGSVSQLLEIQLSENAEGNLLIVAQQPSRAAEIREGLSSVEGVESFSQFEIYPASIVSINGEAVEAREIEAHEGPAQNSNFEMEREGYAFTVSVRSDMDEFPDYTMKAGRMLTQDDVGKNRMVLRDTFLVQNLEIEPGDRLMLSFTNRASDQKDDVLIRFEIVGIIALNSEQAGFGDNYIVAPDTLPSGVSPQNVLTIAMVDESRPQYMDDTLVAMSAIPGVLAVEVGALTQLLKNLIQQLNAIPTLVAWLALVAGTAIIANTVALATQERRRQIGVMKTMGLKGWRVLGQLMIENGLIGLIAGVIGSAIGLIATILLVLAAQQPDELTRLLDIRTIGGLLLMSIGVAMGAALLSAWTAAAEKPMNVLRYE